jgi:glutathione S-transferase
MKLFCSPGGLSLSPHIVLREAGAEFELTLVEPATPTSRPILEHKDGQVLHDCVEVLHLIADQYPAAGFVPAMGTIERARMDRCFDLVSVHLLPAFDELGPPPKKPCPDNPALAPVMKGLDQLEDLFSDGRRYATGRNFSIVDPYLFVVANWAGIYGVWLPKWPHLYDYGFRMRARPAVEAAMRAEGLI